MPFIPMDFMGTVAFFFLSGCVFAGTIKKNGAITNRTQDSKPALNHFLAAASKP